MATGGSPQSSNYKPAGSQKALDEANDRPAEDGPVVDVDEHLQLESHNTDEPGTHGNVENSSDLAGK